MSDVCIQQHTTIISLILVNWDDEIPNIWENKTCSKPPTIIRITFLVVAAGSLFTSLYSSGGWLGHPSEKYFCSSVGMMKFPTGWWFEPL